MSYASGSLITYKRNPNYWDPGKPYLDGLTFAIIPDATVSKLAFQKGDLSRVTVAGGSDANELQKAGFTITTAPGGTFFLVPNSAVATSPWADIKVRQAGFYALDRITLAKALGLGYLNPAYQLYPGYSDSKIPGLALSDNDTAKAKDLLNQAGYPNGFKTPIPTDYMLATANMLRAVGIDVTTDSPESGRYTDLRSKGWNDGLLNHGSAASVNKNSVFQTYFMGLDFVSLKIPDTFKAAATASINSKAYDPKLVQAAFKVLCDDVTVIPYAEQVQCCFYQKGAHNPDSVTFGNLLPHWKSLWLDKSAR